MRLCAGMVELLFISDELEGNVEDFFCPKFCGCPPSRRLDRPRCALSA